MARRAHHGPFKSHFYDPFIHGNEPGVFYFDLYFFQGLSGTAKPLKEHVLTNHALYTSRIDSSEHGQVERLPCCRPLAASLPSSPDPRLPGEAAGFDGFRRSDFRVSLEVRARQRSGLLPLTP
jgi:hypothetical protein